jgi:hypothetical protein
MTARIAAPRHKRGYLSRGTRGGAHTLAAQAPARLLPAVPERPGADDARLPAVAPAQIPDLPPGAVLDALDHGEHSVALARMHA